MNKKLTLKEAYKLNNKYFKKVKDKASREFHILHSKDLIQTTAILSKGKNVDKNILQIASLIHDIGYSVNAKDHPKHSIAILEKEGYMLNNKLKDCILNHSSVASPLTTEGKIFQMADKINIFNPIIISILVKYNKNKIKSEDLDFLKSMSDKAINYLKKYEVN